MQASRTDNRNPSEKATSAMAFLQARMGSRRLPGKALMRIHGLTILERAIRRLQASPAVHDTAVLTTTLPEDDAIALEAKRLGVRVHRGSELDVLQRFQEAADRFHPEIVIRATADNPLIEIGSILRIVEALRFGHLDWCMEKELPYGAATEAIAAEALARVHFCAREPRHREHVTLYIKEHPDEFRTALLDPPDALRHPGVRLTVDTPEDFQYVDWLIGMTPDNGRPAPLSEYLALASTRIIHEGS